MISDNKYVMWAVFPFILLIALAEALWAGLIAVKSSLADSYQHIKEIYTN